MNLAGAFVGSRAIAVSGGAQGNGLGPNDSILVSDFDNPTNPANNALDILSGITTAAPVPTPEVQTITVRPGTPANSSFDSSSSPHPF